MPAPASLAARWRCPALPARSAGAGRQVKEEWPTPLAYVDVHHRCRVGIGGRAADTVDDRLQASRLARLGQSPFTEQVLEMNTSMASVNLTPGPVGRLEGLASHRVAVVSMNTT